MELTPRLRLMNWLVRQGLTGLPETICCAASASAAGRRLDLSRGLVFIDTLHPIFEGRGFRWNATETNESDSFEYGSTARVTPRKTGAVPPSTTCSDTAMTSCGSISRLRLARFFHDR